MWTENERAIMGDVYRFLQRHYDTRDDDAYWDDVCGEACGLLNRYKGHELAGDMIAAACLHLERRAKAMEDKGKAGA